MANKTELQQAIFHAVDVVVGKRVEELDFDKTILATVEMVTDAAGGVHRLKYNGGSFTAYSKDKTVYEPNTLVYVQVPQNDFSQRKIIIDRATNLRADNDITIVSSNINNYMPIGVNPLSLKPEYKEKVKDGVGLNSYTPTAYLPRSNSEFYPYQDSIILYDRATGNGIYNLNAAALETCMQEASALMIKSNFRTILTQEQQMQYKGEYAVVADIVFQNIDDTYKTQGEMFKALENKTLAQRSVVNTSATTENVSMGTYRNNLDTLFASGTNASSASAIDAQFNLVKSFMAINDTKFTEQEKEIFGAFVYLGNDIKKAADYPTKYNLYWDWFNQELYKDEPTTKTLSYVIDSSHMIGSPFNSTTYMPQYSISPVEKEKFKYIDRIYFYCNGFIEDTAGWQWVNKNRPHSTIQETKTVRNVSHGEPMYNPSSVTDSGYLGKDIWSKGLEILPLKEISDEYNGYKLKLSTPLGAIFYSTSADEELKIQASLLYQDYTDLTSRGKIYWFVKDSKITSPLQEGYHYYGGTGWHLVSDIDKVHSTVTITANNNRAYKNEYMCAVSYRDTEQGDILLKQYITIYNESCKREIVIESDLGTTFKFDSGTPTLTCKMGVDLEHLLEESFEVDNNVRREDEAFQFYWSIRTGDGTIIPLDQTSQEIQQILQDTVDIAARSKLETSKKYLLDVEFPKGLTGNKIKYPISKFAADSSAITFICQVYSTDDLRTDGSLAKSVELTNWFSVGEAELTLVNEGMNSVSEYTIVIDGGSQVFQYSETGVAPTFASGVTPTDFRHTDPQELLELKAHLFYQNGLEVGEQNYTVKWLYPTEESLIVNPEGLTIDPATGKTNMLTLRTATFGIVDSYNYDALDNQIQCVIQFNDVTYTKYTEFTFSKIGDNGTNGTDVIAKITVKDAGNFLDTQPLTLFLDSSDNPIGWNVPGSSNEVTLILELYNRTEKIDSSNYDTYVLWDTPCKKAYTQFVELTPGDGTEAYTCKLKWNKNKETERVAYRCQLITAHCRLDTTNQEYHCTLPFCTVKVDSSSSSARTLLNRDFLGNKIYVDQRKYLKQILYNSDGRNPQYNKNQGVKIAGLGNRPIKWSSDGGLHNMSDQDPYNMEVKDEDGNVIETLYSSVQDQRKYDVPFSIVREKNSIEPFTTDIQYGIDQIYIHPADVFTGESSDNNVIVTVYDCDNIEAKDEQYRAALGSTDKNYMQQLQNIDNSIQNVYLKAQKSAASGAVSADADLQRIESELRNYGITSVSSDINNNIFCVYRDTTYSLTEMSSFLSSSTYASVSNLANSYKVKLEGTVDDIVKTLYQTELEELETQRKNVEKDYYSNVQSLRARYYNPSSGFYSYTITVPIFMMLNTYTLASLNAWDGTHVDINEDMGYIMAPQIGAGQKHPDNTFSGIVMGALESYDVYKVTEEDQSVGLMGFHHGLQSILLDAHTGRAVFGLPEEVRRYDDDGNLKIREEGDLSTETDYTQGRIILEPNGTSQIGNWKIGSRALYNYYGEEPIKDPDNPEKIIYVDKIPSDLLGRTINKFDDTDREKEEVQIVVGEPYDDDYSDEYFAPAPDHIIDIPHDHHGLLMHASPPYISVKGKLWRYQAEFMNREDSLEIQLDPQSIQTPFAIYRHYKAEDDETGELVWRRQLRAGVDASGRFWSNALLNPSADGNSSGSMQVEDVSAFGYWASSRKATYAGFNCQVGPNSERRTVAKLFVEKSIPKLDENGNQVLDEDGNLETENFPRTSPLYITGGDVTYHKDPDTGEIVAHKNDSEQDEYARPISIHGDEIYLYARDKNTKQIRNHEPGNKVQLTTDTKIVLTDHYKYTYTDITKPNKPVEKTMTDLNYFFAGSNYNTKGEDEVPRPRNYLRISNIHVDEDVVGERVYGTIFRNDESNVRFNFGNHYDVTVAADNVNNIGGKYEMNPSGTWSLGLKTSGAGLVRSGEGIRILSSGRTADNTNDNQWIMSLGHTYDEENDVPSNKSFFITSRIVENVDPSVLTGRSLLYLSDNHGSAWHSNGDLAITAGQKNTNGKVTILSYGTGGMEITSHAASGAMGGQILLDPRSQNDVSQVTINAWYGTNAAMGYIQSLKELNKNGNANGRLKWNIRHDVETENIFLAANGDDNVSSIKGTGELYINTPEKGHITIDPGDKAYLYIKADTKATGHFTVENGYYYYGDGLELENTSDGESVTPSISGNFANDTLTIEITVPQITMQEDGRLYVESVEKSCTIPIDLSQYVKKTEFNNHHHNMAHTSQTVVTSVSGGGESSVSASTTSIDYMIGAARTGDVEHPLS